MEIDESLPVINCHTHIFTSDHVPRYLGKKLIPFPFWLLVSTPFLIKIVTLVTRFREVCFSNPVTAFIYRLFHRGNFYFNRLTQHTQFGYVLTSFLSTLLAVVSVLIIFKHFPVIYMHIPFVRAWINSVLNWKFMEALTNSGWWQWLIVITGLLLIDTGRNFLLFILRLLKYIPGPATFKFLQRYISIGVFSRFKTQDTIFNKLRSYYPDDTRFVILPMDMDYMGAGPAIEPYPVQLEKLRVMKAGHRFRDQMLPFVFADPRRLADDPAHYNVIIDLLENHHFAGVKIYPAEGYYPFDKNLLKLFLYCCSGGRNIPITTHCIRGVIFYRGLKQKDWDFHPVFLDEHGVPIKLTSFKNVDFINNFTHPLNYVCLLEPMYLAKVLYIYNDPDLDQLFGYYRNGNGLPQKDLRGLKMCFGHFGGEDEWHKFLTDDINKMDNPHKYGLDKTFEFGEGEMNELWKHTSWFTIVRNCLLKYPNTFADISFTLYDDTIFELLKDCLQTPLLQDKILYGTDFYVVRQKKSDKEMWVDILSQLNAEELYRIAKKNPVAFIKNRNAD